MNDSRQRVRDTLAGQPTDQVVVGPLAVHYCAGFKGVSLRTYTTDARALADCVLHYYERFRPDAVWLSADTWVTAEAMGAAVGFPGDDQPLGGVGEPLVQSREDIDRIPEPDVMRQGRCPLMIDALQRLIEGLRGRAFVVACFDQYPFSLACALMGMQRMMTSVLEDPPLVTALLERCSEYTRAYAVALARAGADMLSGGDSPAGLLGPQLYREFALPAEQRVIASIREETSVPISLHVCGNALPILADMSRSGADVLELDQNVDLDQACSIVGPEIALWGNLDPVSVLARGRDEQVVAAAEDALQIVRAHGRRRFVLSSGCTLAMETPPENLEALIQVARQWKW